MNTVELSVRSKLMQVVDELKAIGDEAERTSSGLNSFANNVGKTTEKQIKNTETFLGRLRGMGSKVAKSMSEDFKALFSLVGVTEGLKLGNVFRENIKETFELSDTIRKLASIFGIAEDRFVGFQTKLTKGLGEIGLSSESAVNALKGLSETQVRGEEQLSEYAKAAGMLASIGGQKGQEGAIAKGMAGTLTAQGKNPNDINAMKSLSDDLRKSFNATGKTSTEVLSALESIMAKMPQDFRKALTTSGLVKMGTAAAIGGPNSTKFLEEYLGKSPIARKALEARGFKGVFGAGGLDTQKFRGAAKGVINQFPGDPRMMAQTLGLSEDAAEGFIRLYESLDKVDEAQAKMEKDTKALGDQYNASMTASEAFSASLNKLKASLATPIAYTTNFITTGLQKAFKTSFDDLVNLLPAGLQSSVGGAKKKIEKYLPDALDKNLGSTAVVAGGGVLAALMAGGGLKSIMKLGQGKAGGIAERMAYETVTGAKVQDVYVVNANEIGSAATGGGAAGETGLGTKIAAGTAAFAGGAAVGNTLMDPEGAMNQWMHKNIPGLAKVDQTIESGVGASVDWLAEKFGNMTGAAPIPLPVGVKNQMPAAPAINIQNQMPAAPQGLNINRPTAAPALQQQKQPQQSVDVKVRVQVDTKNKDLKATTQPARGAMQ
jgi:hypothetical protein